MTFFLKRSSSLKVVLSNYLQKHHIKYNGAIPHTFWGLLTHETAMPIRQKLLYWSLEGPENPEGKKQKHH